MTGVGVVLFAWSVCALAITRICIESKAEVWIAKRNYHAERAAFLNGCPAFHEIMAAPKPWYVKLHKWLEDKHV